MNERNPIYNAYDKDIAMVTFFFESSTVFEFGIDVGMTLEQFISLIGGLWGLCIGISLISIIEVYEPGESPQSFAAIDIGSKNPQGTWPFR